MRFEPDFLLALFRDPVDPAYRAAAERRAARGPEPWWLRLSSRTGSLLTVAVVGFLCAVAYHQVVAAEPESGRTRAGLVDEVRSRQAATDELTRRAERLRDDVDRQRSAALDETEAARLRTLAAAAGLGRVRGDGIMVEVRDAPDATDPVTGAVRPDNPGRVLDRDLQAVVNTLWHAGAEAVAINGQRLSAASTIRAAGVAILVDFKPVASPYRVTAIGPGSLERDFERSSTREVFRQLARRYNMSMTVRREGGITMPAATDPRLRYAQVPSPSPSLSPSVSPSPAPSGGR